MERRSFERRPMTGRVGFRRSREARYEVALHDLSQAGCRIESAERLVRDDRIWIALPGLEPLLARVGWGSEWTAGAAFERVMHPAVFDHVTKTLRAA